MKNVLITGANSYIGVSFENYAAIHYSEELKIETLDMLDSAWREKDFSSYDVVYHVAGIAHADVGKVNDRIIKKYYEVNTDLAIETAKKAKKEGVSQFIFMSSAIIYGESAPCGRKKCITKETVPSPANFYGDSKWQGDKGIRSLESDSFKVSIIRPPMIYGKGSKGNYQVLSKIAKRVPLFPDIKNERSILYIDNLCEFLAQVMIRGERGIFWPQNNECVRTSEIVRVIAEVTGHKVFISKLLNWMVFFAMHIPGRVSGLTNKAFGNMSYDQDISKYNFEYIVVSFRESIERTER